MSDESMTRTSAPEMSAVLIPGAHRVIRVLDPSEGPFAGALVTDGDRVAVCRDAEGLTGWEGWRFAGSEHVAGPTDLVRRTDGHDVLLPWCTERVTGFIARRESAGERLSAGECSTLLVSLLRALSELGSEARDAELRGVWWLTDDGRPVFVIGDGERARDGVTRLIAQLAETNEDRLLGRLFTAVEVGVAKSIEQQPRVPQLLLEKWEGELLEIAAPRALRRDLPAPERGPTAIRVREIPDASRPPTRRAMAGDTATRGASGRFSRPIGAVRGLLASASGRAIARFGGRGGTRSKGIQAAARRSERDVSRPRASRKRAVLVATAAAAVVLTVGVLWPSGDGSGDGSGAEGSDSRSSASRESGNAGSRGAAVSGQSPGKGPTVQDSAGQSGGTTGPVEGTGEVEGAGPVEGQAPTEGQAPVEGTAPVDAAPVLWRRIEECRDDGDTECPGAVAPGSAAVVQALAAHAGATPQFTLLDEYGDIAVLRLDTDAAAVAGKVLVLVRLNEKWLVRDVYDVADQPK